MHCFHAIAYSATRHSKPLGSSFNASFERLLIHSRLSSHLSHATAFRIAVHTGVTLRVWLSKLISVIESTWHSQIRQNVTFHFDEVIRRSGLCKKFQISRAIDDDEEPGNFSSSFSRKLPSRPGKYRWIVTGRYIGKQLCPNCSANCFTRFLDAALERSGVFPTKLRPERWG